MSFFAFSLDLMLISHGLGVAHPAQWSVPGILTALFTFCTLQSFALGFLAFLPSCAENLVQYARAELLGRPIEELFPEWFPAFLKMSKHTTQDSMPPAGGDTGGKTACCALGWIRGQL